MIFNVCMHSYDILYVIILNEKNVGSSTEPSVSQVLKDMNYLC